MAKGGPHFDPEAYAPVAERIRLFYQAHPLGRIETQLVSRTDCEIVFKALVFRTASDPWAAATGWAAEREGDGEVNLVACLENTETSAIGRALANLGFTASRQRPSAEEMGKAARRRMRLIQARRPWPREARHREPGRASSPPNAAPPPDETSADDRRRWQLADATLDALRMLGDAERAGLAPRRAESLRDRLRAGLSLRAIERLESALRRWVMARTPRDVP